MGDAVAFVVANTREAAYSAAQRIEVDYLPLPAVTDVDEALGTDAPQVWSEAPGNVCFHCLNGDREATRSAFTTARRVVRRRIVFSRVTAVTLEPRATVGVVESGALTLYTPSQGTHLLRDQLAVIFGRSVHEVRVVTDDVGGAFGMKAYLYPEQVLTLFAAERLGCAVKWTADRSADAFLADNHARDQKFDVELALDAMNRFKALRVHTTANLGAYLSNAGPSNSTYVDPFPGPYEIPAASIEVHGVFTNTAPIDSYRGAVRAEQVYPLERIIDAAARELDLDSAALRRENFAKFTDGERTNCLGLTIQGRSCEPCLDAALARSSWTRRDALRAEARSRSRAYGVGLACYTTVAVGER